MTRHPASAVDEHPVWFEAGSEHLLGVVTRPTGDASGIGVLLLGAGQWLPAPGRGRMWVDMARRLAEAGHLTLRFDYRGVGESTGKTDKFRMDEPMVEDAVAAVRCLLDQGVDRVVLAGLCFGARTAMAAVDGLDRRVEVAGMALFVPAVRDFELAEQIATKPTTWLVRKAASRRGLRGMLSRERRRVYWNLIAKKWGRLRKRLRRRPEERAAKVHSISPVFLRQLTALVDRQIPVLLVYGRDDAAWHDFTKARRGRLGQVLDRAGGLVTVIEVDDKVHGMLSATVQADIVDAISGWLPTILPEALASTLS